MDTSDSQITFDMHGVCDHCRGFEVNVADPRVHRRREFLVGLPHPAEDDALRLEAGGERACQLARREVSVATEADDDRPRVPARLGLVEHHHPAADRARIQAHAMQLA